jgi:hypothetical protein
MNDRVNALREVTLAIAAAAADRDPDFAETLGTTLRRSLLASSGCPASFDETIAWLKRFEALHKTG